MDNTELQSIGKLIVKLIKKTECSTNTLAYLLGYMAKNNITINLENVEQTNLWYIGYTDAKNDEKKVNNMDPNVEEFIPRNFSDVVSNVTDFVLKD